MSAATVGIDSNALGQLVQVLRLADSPSTEAQRQVVEQLDYFSKNVPELPAYLVNIFALARTESELVRVRAGLSLKNTVQQRLAAFPPPVLDYVKETVWAALEDESSAQIRNTASSVLDWLIRCIGPLQWPQAIARLVHCMNSSSPHAKEAAYKTIANICRQSPRVMGDVEVDGQRPLDIIIPTLIRDGLDSSNDPLRQVSLNALNSFIVPHSPALAQHMQAYLKGVFNASNSSSSQVRQGVVEALNTLLTFWPEQIIPHIEAVLDFMLHCLAQKDDEEEVALVAAEFLLTFTEEPDLYDQLQIHIERFLPGLLLALRFTPSSREVLDLDEEDYAKPDKASDVKPHIYKNRTTGGSSAKVPSLAARLGMTSDDVAALSQHAGADDGDEDGEDDEDEEEEEDDEEADWTVRIAASKALETSAEIFEGALLEILLPRVTQMLNAGDWFQREAAIHALGSVSGGCGSAMSEHLSSLISFLLQSLNDSHPLIRSSAAWTLGEYSWWVADEGNSHLLDVMQGLLNVSLDNNKHAQSNAISAFGQLAKEAGPSGALAPYLQAISQSFVAAFSKYQSRNILKLYDTIAHLSDGVGAGGLSDAQVLSALMPPLIERWQQFPDDDQNLLHLLGCLTSLVVAAGPGFQAYADPVFERAYRIITTQLYRYQAYQEGQPDGAEAPEKAWLVVSLDLVSGLVQALGSESTQKLAPIAQPTAASEVPLLLVCMSYPETDVKQSTFALVGDIASRAIEALYPMLNQLMPVLVEGVNPQPKLSQVSAESNCIWCIGELAMALGNTIEPFVKTLLERMTPILSSIKASPNLLENTVVSMGRLALAAPEQVGPHLGEIIRIWSQTMVHVSVGAEQDSALRGICKAAAYNPAAIQQGGEFLLQALAKSANPSEELRQLSAPIIAALQQ